MYFDSWLLFCIVLRIVIAPPTIAIAIVIALLNLKGNSKSEGYLKLSQERATTIESKIKKRGKEIIPNMKRRLRTITLL